MIMFLADAHVKASTHLGKQILAGDAFWALKQLERIAIDKEVQTIIEGGDIYDTSTPGGLVNNAVEAFHRAVTDKGIEVYAIQGNHDKTYPMDKAVADVIKPPAHQLFAASGLVKPLTGEDPVTTDGFTVCGIDHCARSTSLTRLADIPPCDILVLHGGFQHLLGFEGSFTFTLDDIPAHISYATLAGHVHIQDMRKTQHGSWFCSPGSLYPWRADEVARTHGVFLLEKDKQPTYVPLDCRRYENLLDPLYEDTAALTARLDEFAAVEPAPVLPTVVVVRGADRVSARDWPGLIIAEAGMRFEEDDEQGIDDALLAGGTLEEALPQAVSGEDDPALFEFLKGAFEAGTEAPQYLENYVREAGADLL